MDGFSAQFGQAKRYGLKGWVRAFYLVIAGCCTVGGGFLYLQTQNGVAHDLWFLRIFAAFLVLDAVYFGLSAFMKFVQLDAQSVSTGGLLQTRTLSLDSVKGRRTISTRNGSYLVLEGKTPEDKRLSISNSFNFDDAWAAWLQGIVDLDEQDRQAVLDAIANASELGDSSEARLAKLGQAKVIAIALSAIGIAAAVALWLAGSSMGVNAFGLLDLLLIVLPWIALILQARSPLLYSIVANKKDPRATLLFVLMAAGFGLLASPFANMHSVMPMTIFGYGCVPGLILGIAFYGVAPKGPRPMVALLVLLGISCFYGNGVVTQFNTQLDTSALRQYTTQISGKTTSSGRSTTYYLHLNSWDPPGDVEKISVSSSLYHSVDVGDTVCVGAHDGALHVGWYTVQSCY